MANRVIWSAHAVSDVEAIARYIEADSPAYAKSVVKKITASVHQLSQFPRSGRRAKSQNSKTVPSGVDRV
ncbi:MAG TPA: type II toxin-antitoxin system RelE/ParE family toxin [Candidatus Angelobacter sp.]|nr:type II toxin-antitoxin system RelE/ParE family toxin [Candidatus Angelobacter sp.]